MFGYWQSLAGQVLFHCFGVIPIWKRDSRLCVSLVWLLYLVNIWRGVAWKSVFCLFLFVLFIFSVSNFTRKCQDTEAEDSSRICEERVRKKIEGREKDWCEVTRPLNIRVARAGPCDIAAAGAWCMPVALWLSADVAWKTSFANRKQYERREREKAKKKTMMKKKKKKKKKRSRVGCWSGPF